MTYPKPPTLSRDSQRERGRLFTAAAGLTLAVTLGGCSALLQSTAPPKNGKPETGAFIQNDVLADEVDTLLAYVWEGEWGTPAGGNIRALCGESNEEESYRFYGSWHTPDSASVPTDEQAAQTAVAELTAWLDARGWTDFEENVFTLDGVGSHALGIAAENSEKGITFMQVNYYFDGQIGSNYPHVVVDVDSDCLVADRGAS